MTANVLAICSGGGAGDLLAATPAMRALHRHFGSPLTLLGSPYAAPVVQDQPFLREVMLDDGAAPERALAREIAARGFTHAVVFWSTARVAGAVKRAGIGVRVGQARRLYSGAYTQRVTVRTETGDTTSHWTDVQMDYARALGATPEPDDFAIDVRLRPADRAEADALRAARGLTGPFAVLHAARGIPLDRVEWPSTTFAAIGDALHAAYGLPIALTGSKAEAPAIARIGAAMRAPNAVVAGETSLMGATALLAGAMVVVALDSGPMHLAAAQGTPTVGIFALRTDLPDRWRPLGPRVAVMRPSYPCPRWHRKETCRTFDCYAHLDPRAVVDAALSVAPAAAVRAASGT